MTRINGIAEDLVALLGTGRQRGGFQDLDMAGAYAVGARIRELRQARGEHVVGRKIGFTNVALWERYGVDAPMGSFVYDSTLCMAEAGRAVCDLAGMPEPRIEPEVVFGLARAPAPGMDEAALLGCIDWVAHGFEIVQSVYPGWRMTGPEAAAAFGLHGALVVGPQRDVAAGDWLAALTDFTLELMRDGAALDRGKAGNVLGGPLSALRSVVDEIARHPGVAAPLAAGDIVTTGTLTAAHPVAAGETWSARFAGIDLPGFELAFVDSGAPVEDGPQG